MRVTSIILAGGRSLRLGKSKALERLGEKSLLEHVVERLQPISRHILIVTSGEQLDLGLALTTEVLSDIYPGKGPLGGIYTGLAASPSAYNIVVGCDMPFLSTSLLHHMIGLAHGFEAVVPRLANGMVEPLHAVYARSCRERMRRQLEANQLAITPLLVKLRVRYVEEKECRRFDPELLSFFNINHQQDLEQAIQLTAEKNR